jgi:hypothetical protein
MTFYRRGSKMPYIGFRASDALSNAIDTLAKFNRRNKSDIIREAMEQYIFENTIIEEDQDWKPVAWNFFDIDFHKINYALSRSNSPEEFFSMISKWTKYQMRVRVDKENLTVLISKGDIDIVAVEPRKQFKERVITNMVFNLEKQYINKLENAFTVEEIE